MSAARPKTASIPEVITELIDGIHAFDFAQAKQCKESNISPAHKQKQDVQPAADEKSATVPWISSNDFSIIIPEDDGAIKRTQSFANPNRQSAVNIIHLLHVDDIIRLAITIKKEFYATFKSLIIQSHKYVPPDIDDEYCSIYHLAIDNMERLVGFLNVLIILDPAVLSVKANIISILQPHIIEHDTFASWQKTGDFQHILMEAFPLNRRVSYASSDNATAITKIELHGYPNDKATLSLSLKPGEQNRVITCLENAGNHF